MEYMEQKMDEQIEAGLHRQAEIMKKTITVCDKCLCASCWNGIFYCDDYKNAGTIEKTMPIRLTQVGSLGYDPAHVRFPLDSVGVSASFL